MIWMEKRKQLTWKLTLKIVSEDLHYVSNIKLANIQLRILTSISLSLKHLYSSY